ncbi:MAG: hypothetical protein EA395_12915 [Phormidium sp. GEM2.Bin31]|nr:MAG: hypothetical protein EA395_12915 [Phormidium sp. GEM2.Bin31]
MGKYNHRQIAVLYYKDYEDLPRWFKFQYSPDGFNDIKYACRSELFEKLKNSEKIILSSEYLEDFSLSQIQEFCSDLKGLGKVEFRVLIYVREPAAYYLSHVQQELKASSRFSVPQNFKYNFLKTIQLWSSVFSRKNIEVRLFQPQKFPQKSVIVDFQNFASDFFQVKMELESTIYLNRSLSAEGIVVLQNYRKLFYPNADHIFKEDSNTLVSLLKSSVSEVEQTKAKLSPEVEGLVTTLHQEDIHELNRTYGVDVSEFGIVQDDRVQPNQEIHNKFLINGDKVEEILEFFDTEKMFDLMFWLLQKQIKQTQVKPSLNSSNITSMMPIQETSSQPRVQPKNPEKTKASIQKSGYDNYYQRFFKWVKRLIMNKTRSS